MLFLGFRRDNNLHTTPLKFYILLEILIVLKWFSLKLVITFHTNITQHIFIFQNNEEH